MNDIEWLADQGVTKGCSPPINDLFCPNDQVTRGQMAAFLVRFLGLTDRDVPPSPMTTAPCSKPTSRSLLQRESQEAATRPSTIDSAPTTR